MIKKVKVEQLKPGMYIHDMNCGWIENPFLTKSLSVKNDKTVQKIVSQGLREVYIDTDRGDDVKDAPTQEEVKKELQTEMEKVAETKPEPPPAPPIEAKEEKPAINYDPNEPNRIPVREEIREAKKIQKEAKTLVTSLMDDVRLGKQIDTDKSAEVVEKMVNSVFRNRDALASLSRIKNADEYTFQHSISVCVLMISFCKTLGVDKDTISKVAQGAMLHDIGKMKVPSEVLNKPGKLTDEEFGIMKRHTNEGKKLLEDTTNLPPDAIEVAVQHHERFDGSGYPFRLKGEEIGQYGQMAAIVDVYDALTSDRCYHKGMSSADALRKIFEWSKFHFDKILVQKYIRAVGVYPVGTLVRLKSGYLGVIVEPGVENIMLPTVRVIYSLKSRTYLPTPIDKDLAKPNGKGNDQIIGSEDPDLHGIEPLSFLEIF